VICVDTSVLIDLLRGNEAVTTHLAGTDRERGLCYPVACELYKGVYKSGAPEKGEREVGGLVRHLEYVEAGPAAAQEFGRFKQSYPNKSEFDLMIAAITSAADASLLTRDTDFEGLTELPVEII